MSLPRAFAARLESIPAEHPYLHADASSAAAWRRRLPDDGRLLVGLAWAGSAHTEDADWQLIDRRRSLSLRQFAPLFDIPGVQLVSLQKDRIDQPADAQFALLDLMRDIIEFADTAALVVNLDLVISVDTAVAHLSGGLGRPVWLLSRHDGCWRWMHGRNDSPWYRDMRIYRQQRPLDWSGVVARLCADLALLVQRGAPGS